VELKGFEDLTRRTFTLSEEGPYLHRESRLDRLASELAHLSRNRTAGLCATRRGEQNCCADANAKSGSEAYDVAHSMILGLNQLFAPVNYFGNAVSGAIYLLGGLINHKNRGFQ